MKIDDIVDAMLYSRYLFEDICESLDCRLERFGARTIDIPTMKAFDRALKIINEKIAIINAKVIVDDTINQLQGRMKSIVVDKFQKDVNINDISCKYGLNENACGKAIQRARMKMYKIIEKKYSTFELITKIKDSPFLMGFIKKISKMKENNCFKMCAVVH